MVAVSEAGCLWRMMFVVRVSTERIINWAIVHPEAELNRYFTVWEPPLGRVRDFSGVV